MDWGRWRPGRGGVCDMGSTFQCKGSEKARACSLSCCSGAAALHKLALLPTALLTWKTRRMLSGVRGVLHILLKARRLAWEGKLTGECTGEGCRRKNRLLRK